MNKTVDRAVLDAVRNFYAAGLNYRAHIEWASSRLGGAHKVPTQADIGYPTPGSLGSWLGVDRGLPVLTIELPPGGYEGFRDQARRALAAAVQGPS